MPQSQAAHFFSRERKRALPAPARPGGGGGLRRRPNWPHGLGPVPWVRVGGGGGDGGRFDMAVAAIDSVAVAERAARRAAATATVRCAARYKCVARVVAASGAAGSSAWRGGAAATARSGGGEDSGGGDAHGGDGGRMVNIGSLRVDRAPWRLVAWRRRR
jgi:hypothetical protein